MSGKDLPVLSGVSQQKMSVPLQFKEQSGIIQIQCYVMNMLTVLKFRK